MAVQGAMLESLTLGNRNLRLCLLWVALPLAAKNSKTKSTVHVRDDSQVNRGSALHLLNAEPRLLSLGLLHGFGAGEAGVGGDGFHVNVLSIYVPRRLVRIAHNDDVVPAAEWVLRAPTTQQRVQIRSICPSTCSNTVK